jgi:hypothetical protein
MKRKINDGGDGTVFLAKDSYNVNMFHHGTLLHIVDPQIQQYINELIKSINSGEREFEFNNDEFVSISTDDTKIFTVYNRYTFAYDKYEKPVVVFNGGNKKIIITNPRPKFGDHQYALQITDRATGILDVFGLYW